MALEWFLYVLEKYEKKYYINVCVNVWLKHFLRCFSGAFVVVIVSIVGFTTTYVIGGYNL